MSGEFGRRDVLRTVGATVGAAGLLGHDRAVAVGSAQQSTESWRQFRFGTANTGAAPDNSGPGRQITEQWRFDSDDTVISSPAVADGTVYVGSYDNNLYAFDSSDGSEQWRFGTGDSVFSSPAVVGGTVYVGSNEGTMYAVDAQDGTEQWQFSTDQFILSSPVIVNNTVYIGAIGTIYALSAADGTEQWQRAVDGTIVASPAFGDGAIYIGTNNGRIYALDPQTGTERWVVTIGASVAASAAVTDGTVYVGTDDNAVYALDTQDGGRQWRFETGGAVQSSPAAANGTVYVGSNDTTLYALDAQTGTEQWRFGTDGTVFSSPAVVDGAVYVGSDDASVYAVDADSGTQRWRFETNDEVRSSPAVANGSVYVGSADNGIYALSHPLEVSITYTQTGDRTLRTRADTQTASETAIVRYEWAFGADADYTATGEVVTNTFDSGGTYTVRLRVTDSRGRTETVTRDIPVESQQPLGSAGDVVRSSDDSLITIVGSGAALLGASVLGGGLLYRRVKSGTSGSESSATAESNDTAATDDTDETAATDESREAAESDESPTDDASGDHDNDPAPDRQPDTAANRFATACSAVTSLRTVSDDGPIHAYDGYLADGDERVELLTVAPEYDDEATETFTRLLDRWSGISHNRHIADVYETGTEPRPWAAATHGDGRLTDVGAQLDDRARLAAFEDVVEALNTAGLYNVSHGGITPSVVTMTDGTAALTHWGMAQVFADAVGQYSVNPYTAPEQLDGRTTATTDIYQTGLLAYWLWTGREPFDDAEDLEAAIRDGELPPPTEVADVPEQFDTVIARATDVDPDRRYSSATELRDAIRAIFA